MLQCRWNAQGPCLPSLLPSETVGQSYPKDRRLRDYPVSIENQLNNQNHDIEIPVLRSITIFPGPLDEVSRQGNPWFVTDFGLPRGVKVDELGVREKRVKRQGCGEWPRSLIGTTYQAGMLVQTVNLPQRS
jgi:hypothetical protein